MASTDTESAEIVPIEPLTTEDIKGLILTVRGKQVLLDSDVARLYGYEVKAINQAASRNIRRFPPDFRFRLTSEEVDALLKSHFVTLNMRSQIVTASKRNARYLPYAFTQQGIGMLSGILKNDIAVQVSIGIMNAFVEMQQFINTNREVFANIANINRRLIEHDDRFLVQDTKIDEILNLLSEPEAIKQSIFYSGQFYDAFTLLIGFIQAAREQITIIDNYADNSVLDMLANKNKGVAVTLITANPSKLGTQHREKFAKQHGEVRVVESKDFHDRFIIIDNKEVYACGASLKDAGNKCFAIFKSEDTERFFEFVNDVQSLEPCAACH